MPIAEIALQSLRWLPVAALVAAIAIAGTWWFYQPQIRLRGVGLRWGLPLLRTAALLALAIALIKPTIRREKNAAEQGTVLVLIDRSASMTVTDTGRSPAQVMALADGLRLLPPSATPLSPSMSADEVDQLRNQSEKISRAASELDYARLANRGVDAAQARLDDSITQLAQQVNALVSRLKGKKPTRVTERLTAVITTSQKDRDAWLRDLHNRIERVAAAATESENNSDEKIYRESAEVRAVCDRLAKLSRYDLAVLAAKQTFGGADAPPKLVVYGFSTAADLTPIAIKPDGLLATPSTLPTTRPDDPTLGVSDLTGALRAITQHYRPGEVRAVVLFSDGRQVGQTTSIETMAAGLGDVPVCTVRMARSVAPKDLSITRVSAPARAFVGETLTTRVEVRTSGLKGEFPVTITVGDESQTKPATFSNDNTAMVEVTTKLQKAGPLLVRASVPAQKDEVSTDNNTADRWVNVLSDKVHVVAIAQSAGRDFQFLRDALGRTPWVRLDESIAASPDASAGVTREQLNDADAVILEDAGGNLLSADLWKQLRSLVADRGAGAILLTGDAHAADELLIRPDSAELLPFATPAAATWRNWGGEWPSLRAVPDRPAGDRSRLPEALRLTDDVDSALKKWQDLPAMYRLMNLAPLKPNATPLLIDSETHAAVATSSRVGFGQVIFVGMNETWRWRYKIGQRDQDRFWLQLVRQVADEPYAATAGGVSIDSDKTVVEPGRAIHLRARVRDAAGKPSAEPTCELTARSAAGESRAETLRAVVPGSGRYELTVNDLPPGEYLLTPSGAALPSLSIRVATSSEAEMANLAGDEGLLRRIADATGGQLIGPEQLADLPQQLADRAAQRPATIEFRFWDSPYLYAWVVACFALEWAIRKQAGLA